MRKNKIDITDLKVGMVVSIIINHKSHIEVILGRVEIIEKWTSREGLWRVVLMTADPECQASEQVFIGEDDDTVIVEGVL